MKLKLTTKTVQSLSPRVQPFDVRDTELGGFLLRVLPTGSMAYYCDFRRPDGRRTRIKIGDAKVLTPVQARDEAYKHLGDLARGEDPAAKRRQHQQCQLEDFVRRQYQPWVEAHRKTGRETVRRVLSSFPDLKSERLSEITAWKLEKWRSAQLKRGLSAASANRVVSMLRAMLQKAVEWEILELNPLAKLKPLKTDRSPRVRFLERWEEEKLRLGLEAREANIRAERRSYNRWCRARNYPELIDLDRTTFADHLRPMVLISLNTGIRRGELFSLKWEDIDFQRRILTVVGTNAKSGKTRHVPLNREAVQVLEGWKAQSGACKGLVFPGKRGERFDNINSSWEAVLKLTGIEKFRWHDLRHHFASMLVINGVDLNTVRELLGHSDFKLTLLYAHLAPKVKAEAVATLDRLREPMTAALLQSVSAPEQGKQNLMQ